jgi:DNA (cytosine-5)-methyltransferase 1
MDSERIVSNGSANLQVAGHARRSTYFGSDGSNSLDMGVETLPNTMETGTLIDLDELENCDELWNDEADLRILRVEERQSLQSCPKPSNIAIPERNLPITAPLVRLDQYQYKNMRLRPSKTVELIDGDFLVITDIIKGPVGSGDITLRGHRLQRCRSMNGLLEKKLNEVCVFHEVDLDDPRPRQEQSAIETSIYTIKGIRMLRKTNQIFPLCRSLALEAFWTPEDAAKEGRLTVRWKYTCTYTSATDRWHNNPKERSLEFLREDECSKESRASDKLKRFDWRGETVLGGGYRPELEDEIQSVESIRRDSIISLASSNLGREPDLAIMNSPTASLETGRSGKRKAQISSSLPVPSRKRQASSSDDTPLDENDRKKARSRYWEGVEVTRQHLADLSVDERSSLCRDEYLVDLPFENSPGQGQDISSDQTQTLTYPHHFRVDTPSPTVDLSSSDLATPPPTGNIACAPASVKMPVIRSPGQMLTYGDAFCGAGGTTRGAVMAGLRVKWGFDQWEHACSTWRTNFPQAACYKLSSYEFVDKVRGSKYRKPVDSKVDILHLSPPCQYFSPAHTVDCPNDEMNVASLFAVGDVVKVAKPRIVTLEQTFGIVAVRFRKYFNSLIQMFTALGFSVRWAVVNLAQWACSNYTI